eukprot:Em0001g1697a
MPIAPQVILLLAILVGAQCKRLVNAHIAKVSERALLEQQAVSEKWEDDTDYMQDGPTEAPGDVVPEYRSKQTRYGITSTYAIGMSKAYSARLSDSLRDSIRSMKEVKYIERNQEVTAAACSTQKNADWGLVRTTIRDRSNISPDYVYELDNSGEGVNIYIIDSGISIGNAEFENRASWGTDFVESNNSPMSDPNGHGTRVAGLAMSKTFGIAKKASAIAVRVLSATGTGTSAITVMASDSDDSFAWFSNYGSCAHIIAPGVNVKTVGNVFDSGIIAKHIGPLSADQIPTPADMKKYLISTSSTQKITNIPSNTTPNNLVYYPCSA